MATIRKDILLGSDPTRAWTLVQAFCAEQGETTAVDEDARRLEYRPPEALASALKSGVMQVAACAGGKFRLVWTAELVADNDDDLTNAINAAAQAFRDRIAS